MKLKDRSKLEKVIVFSLVAVFFFFVFYFSFASIGKYGLTGYAVDDGKDPNISKEVRDAVNGGGSARVIVRLENQTSKGLLRIASVEQGDIKKKAMEKIEKHRLKHDFNTTLALEISEKELEELRDSPYIESISIDPPVRAFLQDSTSIINATETWDFQIDGNNITGRGETVCVIDTGVDFSHPDLQGKNITCNIDCINGIGCSKNCSVTDGNGHGTHAAGIVAAQGGINGVAKGANLIGVKVLKDDGSGYMSDVKKGMEWCENNAESYNISVMSLSLGGAENYSSYCDDDYDRNSDIDFLTPINDAVSKNMTVAVATGNYGNDDKINPPACIENATAVGATNKDDTLASYSNLWNLSMLVAPGTNINSTWNNGNYNVESGTSMSTPHVAGAVALLQNYKKSASGRTLRVSEIEEALNNTGKKIQESVIGESYSRIDTYSSLGYIDEESPHVNLVSPRNNSFLDNKIQNLTCNVSDLDLKNITLRVWNSTGDLRNESSENISGTYNETTKEIDFEYGENISWNCYACDTGGRCGYSETNYSFMINSAPEFNNSKKITNRTWSEDTNISINLTGRFYDNEGDNLTYNYSRDNSNVENLTIKINQTSENATIIPNENFFGLRWIIFTANDGYETAESNNVTLNITNVNDAPYFTNVRNVRETKTYPFSYNLTVEDVDNSSDELTYNLMNYTNITGKEINFTINSSTGLLENSSETSYTSVHEIYVNVTDGVNTTIENFNITFNALPRISYETFSSNLTTNISEYNDTTIQNVSDFSIGVEGKGKINYSLGGGESLNLSLLDINAGVIISDEHIEVNSTLLPELDKTARLTFYGISYKDPGPVKDGESCSSCTELGHDPDTGEYVYEVESFSIYSVEETYVEDTSDEGDDSDTSTSSSGGGAISTEEDETENDTENVTDNDSVGGKEEESTNDSEENKTVIQEFELLAGKEIKVSKGDKFYIEFNSTEYEIEITNISIPFKKVNFVIFNSSEDISSNVIFKFNLNGDGFYDLEIQTSRFSEQVLTDGSTETSATLHLEKIHSEISEEDKEKGGAGVRVKKEDKESWWKNWYFLYIAGVLVVILGYFYWRYIKHGKGSKPSS